MDVCGQGLEVIVVGPKILEEREGEESVGKRGELVVRKVDSGEVCQLAETGGKGGERGVDDGEFLKLGQFTKFFRDELEGGMRVQFVGGVAVDGETAEAFESENFRRKGVAFGGLDPKMMDLVRLGLARFFQGELIAGPIEVGVRELFAQTDGEGGVVLVGFLQDAIEQDPSFC